MIAADTSTWIAFLQGDAGQDTELLEQALQHRHVLMVPVVLTEMLSDPGISSEVSEALAELPFLEIRPGYWQRAGELRAKVLAKRPKARLGDALIAQNCIDQGVFFLRETVTSRHSPTLPASISSCQSEGPYRSL